MANLDIIRGRQVVEPLTNRSGGQVIAGDVVVIDTANNASFTTTTQFARASNTFVGVVQETIANSSNGRVLIGGYAPFVNVSSAVSVGMYAYTHTVAKQAVGSNALLPGAFGVFLTASATPEAHIFGHPTLPVLNVTESDNSPTVFNVHKIIVSPGTLTDNGGGTVTLTTGGGGGGSSAFVGARVYHNANQTITTATDTVLAFNSERFDSHGFHDTVTNNSRLTIPAGKAGKYMIGASSDWVANATGIRELRLRINGTTYIALTTGDADLVGEGWRNTLATLYDLAVGDYVEAIVRQTSGGNLDVQTNGSYSPEFWLAFMGT